jgi:group I intron endonuclease
MEECKMIIYKATNLVNSKVYIGLTTETLEQRKSRHLRDAFNQDSNLVFHMALRKYGKDNFQWEIIDDVATNESELKEKEIYYISLYKSYIHADKSNGYNMTMGGEGTFGYSHSEETRLKMSEAKKGRIITEESRLKMSIARKGRKITDKTKKKMSDSSKGKIHTDDTKKKLSNIRIKNESSKGSNNPKSKLNERDVVEIKQLLKSGIRQKEIANAYGVTISVISKIKSGEIWKHIDAV